MANLNIEDPMILLIALAVNIIVAFLAYKAGHVDKSAVVIGCFYGTTIFVAFGWQGFLILLTFFILGSMATKHKLDKKQQMGVAQKKGGARSALHVLANVTVPFLLACSILVTRDYQEIYQLYFATFTASLATAFADTVSTEMGQLYGKKFYLLITMERVKVGTEGAVSTEGSMFGVGACLLLASMAAVLGMFPTYPVKTTILITFAAVISNLVESILGGIFHQFGKSANEFIFNFINTAVGAGLCLFFLA